MMSLRIYTILIAFLILSLIGVTLLPQLPVQLIPSQGGHSLTVTYSWRGAAPEAVERQVTSRLEGAFSMLAGVKNIRSVSSYNMGHITLEVDRSTDIDVARFEVAALVRQVYPQLPHELSYPQITLHDLHDQDRVKPMLTLQLSGPASPGTLQRYADEQLKPRLAVVPDVGNIAIFGGTRPEWILTYNAHVLASLQLTETDLQQAIQQHLRREPLGQIQQAKGQTLRVSLDNAGLVWRNWASIPVINKLGRIVHLSDLVTIGRKEPPAEKFYRVNGRAAVNIVLSAVEGSNQLLVVEGLRQNIASLKLPPGFRIYTEYDITTYIRENLRKIGIQTGVAVMVLLLFVALTTRSKRYVLLITTSTLVTLLLSVLVFLALHVEIHLFSLAALTTSLGLVMDNVVIMINHYRRYRDVRVFTALLGATLTTCVGLVVIWFLPEENRQALSDFALVMAITLFVSLLVSVGFVPAMMERFWKGSSGKLNERVKCKSGLRRMLWWEQLYTRLLSILIQFRGVAVVGAVLLFGLPLFWLPTKLAVTNPLSLCYNSTLGSDWYIDNLQEVVNKWLGGTLRLFVNYVYEGSYQREPERTSLNIIAELPNESTLEQMNTLFQRFENDLKQYKEVDKFITQINNGQEGSLIVYFREPHDQSIFPYLLKKRAILLSTQMSGVDWDIFGIGQGFSQKIIQEESPTFSVEMFGYNYRQLNEQAGVLAKMLKKHPRILAVNLNHSTGLFQRKSLSEFNLQTDPQSLGLSRISATSLYDRLADYNARPQPDLYAFIQGEYEPIKIIPVQSRMVDVWTLQHQPMQIGTANIKLAEASTLVRQKVIPEIQKEDQQYRRVISFEYFGEYIYGRRYLAKTLDELRSILPLGYTAKALDHNWFGDDERMPYELIGIIVLLIYIVCAVIFESLWQPLALISLIPLSYIGIFLSFYWTDSNFDQGGYASFVLLSGNVVSAGIYIVSEMNRLRKRFPHLSATSAYRKAFRHKVGPVLLTVVSTVVGMVPFLLYQQESFWYALGVGTMGGLLMSLIAMGLYLPLFLLWDFSTLSIITILCSSASKSYKLSN